MKKIMAIAAILVLMFAFCSSAFAIVDSIYYSGTASNRFDTGTISKAGASFCSEQNTSSTVAHSMQAVSTGGVALSTKEKVSSGVTVNMSWLSGAGSYTTCAGRVSADYGTFTAQGYFYTT